MASVTSLFHREAIAAGWTFVLIGLSMMFIFGPDGFGLWMIGLILVCIGTALLAWVTLDAADLDSVDHG